MLFNSWKFFLFFAVVLTVYWLFDRKRQNLWLLAASVLFYAAWDYRFVALLVGTILVGYYCGERIHANNEKWSRKTWLIVGVVYNLGTLAVFKYLGFFEENLLRYFALAGIHLNPITLKIILPVGISFYNFHALSYIIDIYRKEIEPSPRLLDFALFVAFFPLLVAGPIERAKHLLPQIHAPRTMSIPIAREGVWLLFWGLWKKVFVAENLAPIVNGLFDKSATLSTSEILLAAFAFAIQIYCDFSGYTDMARGVARLMGFELLKNFDLPYFAANPSEFWRRWHISLSSWLRDYLYISLGGNRKGRLMTYRNLFLTMLIGGLWHGAAWNFVIWGAYHGILLIIHHLYSSLTVWRMPRWAATPLMFVCTLGGWLIFRANRTLQVNGRMVDDSLRQIQELAAGLTRGFEFNANLLSSAASVLLYAAPLLLFQFLQNSTRRMDVHVIFPKPVNLAWKALLLFLLVRYGVQESGAFIYFQF